MNCPNRIPSAGSRVLIVDDERLIADSLRVYLQDEGMQVTIAGSGEQALQLAHGGAVFDVCIMDMRLPGVDGNGAIRALALQQPGMRFVVHTGSVNYVLPDALRALGINEDHLFRKPLSDMAPLAAVVQELAVRQDSHNVRSDNNPHG